MENIKEKIEKLLNMSMSENEHEARLALDKALKLMNRHNITKDEVYRQQMISRVYPLDKIYRMPDWLSSLYGTMSILSGCAFTWSNGWKGGRTATARITGRERDVENAFYLITFLYKKINNLTKEYTKYLTGDNKRLINKSYKMGLIYTISLRLSEQQDVFFNEQVKGTDLICVDIKTKIADADKFLKDLLNGKIKEVNSKAKYDRKSLEDGKEDGNNIELNQAVNGQKDTLLLEDIK